ncbi:MAG: OsmC family protein [Acidobacteriota bacterium]
MSEHRATVTWRRGDVDFTYEKYSRDHTWSFTGGIEIPASAAPTYLGSGERVDPEEAFVASLSSCHMLTFLALAARKRYVVESYRDAAVGVLEKNDAGKLAVTRVVLRPEIEFSGDNRPSADEIEHLHGLSHSHCFIAQSVKIQITVESARG